MPSKHRWSAEATSKITRSLPEGIFLLPRAVDVAAAVLHESRYKHGTAIRRITFYMNRAGRNLSKGARVKLSMAKLILQHDELTSSRH